MKIRRSRIGWGGRWCRHTSLGVLERRPKTGKCVLCAREGCRAWSAKNRTKDNETSRQWHAANRQLANDRSRAYHAGNREISNSKRRAWNTANPEKRVASHRKYQGVTNPEVFPEVFALQNGSCGICGTADFGKTGPCLDHEHIDAKKRGPARGVLCVRCNAGLGMLKDSTELLLKAIRYLEDPPVSRLVKEAS